MGAGRNGGEEKPAFFPGGPRQGKQARGAVRPGWSTVQATCEGLSEAPALDPSPMALLGPVSREQDYLGGGAPHSHQREEPGRVTGKVAVMALPTAHRRGHPGAGKVGPPCRGQLFTGPLPSLRAKRGFSRKLLRPLPATSGLQWPWEVPAWGLRWGSFSCSRRTASTRKGPSRKARKPGT